MKRALISLSLLVLAAACCTGDPPRVADDTAIVANWTETRLKAVLGVEPEPDIARAFREFLADPAVAEAASRAEIASAWSGHAALDSRSPDLPEWVWGEAQDEAGWNDEDVPEQACAAGFRLGIEQYLQGGG